MKITNIIGREILDSRANPTVEVEIEVDGRVTARASVPSGASTGKREALELRDNDPSRYGGKGVLKAVNNINEIIKPKLIGMDPSNQKEIDAALISLDGTNDKSFLGANAILGVSLACARVAAKAQNKELFEYLAASNKIILPKPMMNVLNGGAHASSSVDFQEYMIMPCSAKSIKEAIRMGSEVFHSLKKILKEDGHITAVGDEGGFAPNLKDNEEPLKYLIRAIEDAGYIPGEDFVIALDIAASEFYEYGLYHLKKSTGAKLTTDEMIEYIKSLCIKYPIISVEDGLSEDDWDGWKKLTAILGDKIQLVGDDLFVTNSKIIEKGIKEGAANAVLIKINQIGTISETIEAINISKSAGYNTIISHRSGETEDTSIADIACALNLGQIKTGSVSRTDRTAKYNQLIRIEEKLSRRN